MTTCKTCGYSGGKKNHSCSLQIKKQLRAICSAVIGDSVASPALKAYAREIKSQQNL